MLFVENLAMPCHCENLLVMFMYLSKFRATSSLWSTCEPLVEFYAIELMLLLSNLSDRIKDAFVVVEHLSL